MPLVILAILIAAGGALVLQNSLMARLSSQTSSILVALVLNSAIGLVVLSALLVGRNGLQGLAEVSGNLRGTALLPGLLGSFFVFASLLGYQKIGAAGTIAVLVSSQLGFGIALDYLRSGAEEPAAMLPSLLGAGLLVTGAIIVAANRL